MKINIHGNKLEVTDAIKSYILEKLSKLDKYFENPDEITATISLRVRGKDQIVEITIPIKKAILRCEETNDDLYASIDFAIDKLERQIRKNKTKMKRHKEKYVEISEFDVIKDEEEDTKVVKRKVIEVKPMSEEEAILQMNMLGHEFFIYKDDETGNTCILYKRKDGDLGLIETK